MSTPITTSTTAAAWSPDVHTFAPADVIGDALVLSTSTVSGRVEGDEPMLRVAYVSDDDAQFVAEGAPIDEANPALSEVTVATGKVATLVRLSREQYVQQQTAGLLSDSLRRAVVKKADTAYLTQPAPTSPAVTPPAGILLDTGIEAAAANIDTDLDPLVDLVAALETNGATPSGILLAPDTWAALRKIKTATGSAATLLGAGTQDAAMSLLGLPVRVHSAVPAGTGVVYDRSAIVSAVGDLQLAVSTDAYFASDSIAVRCTFRFGAALVRPDRVGTFSIAAAG